jgi:nitrate/nitrite transporter NarK
MKNLNLSPENIDYFMYQFYIQDINYNLHSNLSNTKQVQLVSKKRSFAVSVFFWFYFGSFVFYQLIFCQYSSAVSPLTPILPTAAASSAITDHDKMASESESERF